jgi:hypothetical protein
MYCPIVDMWDWIHVSATQYHYLSAVCQAIRFPTWEKRPQVQQRPRFWPIFSMWSSFIANHSTTVMQKEKGSCGTAAALLHARDTEQDPALP